MYLVIAIEVLVTYARVEPGALYHVSGSGLIGGSSRALVLLNYPIALAAIAILILLADRRGRIFAALAAFGIVLCAAVFWPGVVEQSDLDAEPVNAIAALGVAITAALSVLVWWQGALERSDRLVGDRVRCAIAVVALVAAFPWMLADVGISLDGVPILGWVYETGELRMRPGDPTPHPVVHHGHHHGMDGALLVLTALLLSRLLPRMRNRVTHGVAGIYLALMLCYGATNLVQDFWFEQVFERGWASWEIPVATVPSLTPVWAVMVAATLVVLGVSRTMR